MIPISVNGCPSSVMLRPTTSRSPPKCPFQNRYDATATFRGSPSPNVRPAIAATPSKLNNPCSAATVATCSVSPTPCSFLLEFMYEIIPPTSRPPLPHPSNPPPPPPPHTPTHN